MITVLYSNDVYLDPVVRSVKWSGDIKQAARRLDVVLKNTLDGINQAIPIELGREIRLYSDDVELFRGTIFTHDIDASGEMSITAYDDAIYLTKNVDSRKFIGMTASAIIRQLCIDFGIESGEIVDTEYVIPRLILRGMSLFDMMTTALTETTKQTGRRFWLTSRDGLLHLIERGDMRIEWAIENGKTLIDASYMQSIEDMRNRVKVVANDGDPSASSDGGISLPPEALDMISGNVNTANKSAKAPIEYVLSDSELIDRFGLMQHEERLSGDTTAAQAEETARQLLEQLAVIRDTARVEALGNIEVVAGASVYVVESMTKIIGGFYVILDTHTWESGAYRMSLEVSADEGLPKLEYDEPDVIKTKKANGVGDYKEALDRLEA